MSETEAKTIHTGACRCGKVRFSAEEPRAFGALCHCRPCRKGTSAPVSLIIGVPTGQFKWTEGEDLIKRTALSETFTGFYCSECGGYLAQQLAGAPFYGTMGSCYTEVVDSFCPVEQMPAFFRADVHLNYENRVIDVPDALPKFLDLPVTLPRGTGKLYEPAK